MSTFVCPVCDQPQNCDQAAYNHHVESHFANTYNGTASGNGNGDGSGPSKRPISENTNRERDAEDNSSYCPMCDFPLSYLSKAEAQTHVNSCLDSTLTQGVQGVQGRELKRRRTSSSVSSSEVGGDVVLDSMDEDDIYARRQHDDLLPVDEEWQWDGPAKPGGWTQWVGKKIGRGDKWWDPLNGKTSEIPNSFSPGIIPILAGALRTSVQKGTTRRAVLCSDTVHMKSVLGFDMGWGCGYRNALMALSALLIACPAYRPLFSAERNGAQPGVRRVQGWLEESWADGYDPVGREQLKGKVLGTRRWIGPTDLYALFSYKGIPCQLYDFPKMVHEKGVDGGDAHTGLQRWIKQYFTETEHEPRTRTGNAFDAIMRGQEDAVKISTKMPIILQHSGHSRTIIGYEETSKGDINLLLFDPGKTIPKEMRITAIHLLDKRGESTRPTPLPLHRSNGSARSHETMEGIPFSPPYTDGQGNPNPTYTPSISSSSNNANTNEGFVLRSDEEVTQSGWIKKKVSHLLQKSPNVKGKGKGTEKEVIKHFRVGEYNLGKHSQYQILVFPTFPTSASTGEGSILSFDEKQMRKIPRSQVVRFS